ncbi:unnamed protein product [Orchesella dallaii]|uniref:Uncharacterized protein n=1 Tax=Orchesella dallaii TaxID=48710 RepID=A0ABP1RGH1_9HEXA
MATNPCCCCCIFAKTGALLIGCLNIVASLRKVMQISWELFDGNSHLESGSENAVLNVTLGQVDGLVNTGVENVSKPYEVVLAVELFLNVLNIIFAVILVHGIRKEQPCLVKANLIFSILFFGLSLILRISGIFLGVKISFSRDSSEIIANLARAYFIYVVYCAYMEIRVGTLQGMAGRERGNGGSKT